MGHQVIDLLTLISCYYCTSIYNYFCYLLINQSVIEEKKINLLSCLVNIDPFVLASHLSNFSIHHIFVGWMKIRRGILFGNRNLIHLLCCVKRLYMDMGHFDLGCL